MRKILVKWIRTWFHNEDGSAKTLSVASRVILIPLSFIVLRSWDVVYLAAIPILALFVFAAYALDGFQKTVELIIGSLVEISDYIERDARSLMMVARNRHGVGQLAKKE